MSFSEWRSYAAIAGMIIGLCAVSVASPWIASAVHRYSGGVADGQSATPQKQQAGGATVAHKVEPRNVADQQRGDQAECNDLCAQRRMAVAAERQIGLSLLGVVLLAASLFFTGWAAVAASRAALHGRRSADVAEKALRGLERPYIIPGEVSKLVGVNRSAEVVNYCVQCSIGNYGRTPAIIHYIRSSFGPGPLNHLSDPDSPVKTSENTYNSGQVIPANTVENGHYTAYLPGVVNVEPDRRGARLTIDGKASVYFVVNTKFEDTLGVIREGRFTWRYDEIRHRFLRHGGKEYNYERETPGP